MVQMTQLKYLWCLKSYDCSCCHSCRPDMHTSAALGRAAYAAPWTHTLIHPPPCTPHKSVAIVLHILVLAHPIRFAGWEKCAATSPVLQNSLSTLAGAGSGFKQQAAFFSFCRTTREVSPSANCTGRHCKAQIWFSVDQICRSPRTERGAL